MKDIIQSIIGKNVYFLLIFSFLISCTTNKSKYSDKLSYALSAAGKNKGELEKVLKFYSLENPDSLKYKAACFLIENMVHHYHTKGDASILIRDHLKQGKEYGGEIVSNPDIKLYPDIEYVGSQFLIDNIEQSFKVWRGQPWGKYIEFKQFCEEILPYKVVYEPLTHWKENYYNYFQPYLTDKLKDNDPLSAASIIYDVIISEKWKFIQNMSLQNQIEANTLLEYRFGNCAEYAQFATYVMRSLGIPCGIDIILQNPINKFKTHYWNYVKDKEGKSKEFELYSYPPQDLQVEIKRPRAKVYRIMFGSQDNSYPVLYPKHKLPPILDNCLIKDVSDIYFPLFSLNVDLKDQEILDNIVYLCVYNSQEWVPIAISKILGNNVKFKHVEKKILYLPAYYIKGLLIPASYPMMVRDDNTVRSYIIQDSLEEVFLKRKYPMHVDHYFCMDRIIGGKFQVSNYPNFHNSKDIYTISKAEGMYWYKILKDSLSNPGKYRYIRYLSPDSGYCNIAEINFYSVKGELLEGTPIGTKGSWNITYTADKAFDGDPLTFFDAPTASGVWTGLDLGKESEIGRITFLPRNDDNHIREGDIYELFYWRNKWISLGKQVGVDGEDLIYKDVPRGTILFLRNHTRGIQERIFFYEDGKQVWW